MAGRSFARIGKSDDTAERQGIVQGVISVVRVLFICLGNICRSPTAEGVFAKMVADAGLVSRIECDSAGVSDYHQGEPADPRAVEAAKRRGIDIAGVRARQVVPGDLSRFDFLLAMDRPVLRDLSQLSRLSGRGAKGQIGLFLDHAPHLALHDVPDPYLGGGEGFEFVLDLIEEGAKGLLEAIRRDRLG
jgi:protein-tyrosine phosphatase